MTYAISTHSSWAEVSLAAKDGNRVGEKSPQLGKAGRRGHSGGSSETCVRYCNPLHVAGMNLRSFFFLNSHLFGCLRSYLQREESLLNQCDLLLWGTDSLLVLGRQGMWAQWLQWAGLVAMACGILVPQTGIKPASPAWQGRFLTTGPLGESLNLRFESRFPGIPVTDP